MASKSRAPLVSCHETPDLDCSTEPGIEPQEEAPQVPVDTGKVADLKFRHSGRGSQGGLPQSAVHSDSGKSLEGGSTT